MFLSLGGHETKLLFHMLMQEIKQRLHSAIADGAQPEQAQTESVRGPPFLKHTLEPPPSSGWAVK